MLSLCNQWPARVSRREALRVGALGAVGLGLPQLFEAEARAKPAREKSVILIVPWGGPAQVDTLDMKPDAPDDYRGEFKPIATNVPGIHICEHLPQLAKRADRYAIVRSASHKITTHNSATHYALTGHPPAIVNREMVPASRSDWPCVGSMLARLRPTGQALPPFVQLPQPLIDNGIFSGGQNGGFFGPAYDPFILNQDPAQKDFAVTGLTLQPELTGERIVDRRDLLNRLEGEKAAAPAATNLKVLYERAFKLIGSAAAGQAFDLRQEPAHVRQRYGPSRLGQSTLLARRLIEHGVRLVLVGDTQPNTNGRWDTHNGNVYTNLKRSLAETDAALSALLDDLQDRGLLESTLILWMAEFGRSPKMGKGGGRDHWPHCYSFLIAGGGSKGGLVYGSSDRLAGYPREKPVPPEDIHATLYHALGIPKDTIIHDPLGRPIPLCDGTPLTALF